jgi:hypothetical protein
MAALAGLNRDNPMAGLKRVKPAEVGAPPVNEREARLASIRTDDPATRLERMKAVREAREAREAAARAAQPLVQPVDMITALKTHLMRMRRAISRQQSESDSDSDSDGAAGRKNGEVYAKMILKEMLDDERFDDVEVKKLIQRIKTSQLDEWDNPIEEWDEAKPLPSKDGDSMAVQEYKRYWNARVAKKSAVLRRQQPVAAAAPAAVVAPPQPKPAHSPAVVAPPTAAVVATPAATAPAGFLPPPPGFPLSPPPTASQSPIAVAQAPSPSGDGTGIVDIDTWAEQEFQREKQAIQAKIDALDAVNVSEFPLKERVSKRQEINLLLQRLRIELARYNNEFGKDGILQKIKKQYLHQ